MKRTIAVFLTLMLLLCVLPIAGNAEQDKAESFRFAVLTTSDVHGHSTAQLVNNAKTEDTMSIQRAATIIKEQRAAYNGNVLLIDNGDTLQGTLVSQFAVTQHNDEINPMILALDALDYDAFVMGNHEFNYTNAVRDAQVGHAVDAGIVPLAANLVRNQDGKNFFGEDASAGQPYYKPYMIKTFTTEKGNSFSVAVIGLANVNCPNWDVAANYEGLRFYSDDNSIGAIEYEINKWVNYIHANETVDAVIVACHTSTGDGAGAGDATYANDAQGKAAVRRTNNIDLMITGHDHMPYANTEKNLDNKDIYIINGGASTVAKAEFMVEYAADGSISNISISAENLNCKTVASDAELSQLTQPWFDRAYAWASAKLGSFGEGWTAIKGQTEGKLNPEMGFEQTELSNLVHKAQIWATWQSYETEGIQGATVSLFGPVFMTGSDGKLSYIPNDGDEVNMLNLSNLYRYSNNLLCMVEMSGQQLYDWLNAVANMYVINDGALGVDTTPNWLINALDSFYGIDYVLDVTKPKGERVISAMYQGRELKNVEEPIRVAINSYRMGGDYGFYDTTGINEKDLVWTAAKNLGGDIAPVPSLIGAYIASCGEVHPYDPVSHGMDSTWLVLYGSSAVDKTELQKSIREGLDLAKTPVGNPDELPNGSIVWPNAKTRMTYLEALTNAKSVYAATSSSAEEVAAATAALRDALKALVKVDLERDEQTLDKAIFYAKTFMSSTEFGKCSAKLKQKWQSAYDAALAVQGNAQHNKTECSAAAAAIYALSKTGENGDLALLYLSLAGLALAALTVVLVRRRRVNAR